MTEPESREPLLLRAEDAEDLRILSACVQDMAVKSVDIAFRARGRRLVLLGNRFRWEVGQERGGATRIRSALRFEGVTAIERREWPDEKHAVLPLLAVGLEPDGRLLISFGGGTAIRLAVEAIDATLEDLSRPWSALAVPEHKIALPGVKDVGP
ncbi:MAG: DUF2948 family protein [Sandaracinobacteroides sp.]